MTLTRNDSLSPVPGGRVYLVPLVGAVGTNPERPDWQAMRLSGASPLRSRAWVEVGTAPTRKAAVALLVGP